MNNPPKVAVVILNWNGADYLQQFLPAVLATDYPNLDIYVADNASTDNSVKMLAKDFPTVNIVKNDANYGFAGGYNQALCHVSADYFVLLNSDVEVSRHWVTPVIELMESDANIAACQPKILAYHQKTHFEYAGAAGGWIDSLGYAFCRGRLFDICEPDNGQYDQSTEIFWASGCALFIRSNLYHAFGGFDQHFFAHQEEIDLCWRLKRSGYSIYVCPQSVVYHIGGGSLHKSNPRKTFLNYHNNLLMIYKNNGAFRLLWLLPVRMILDWISAVKLLAEGKFADAKAIAKAHFNFLKGLATWNSTRKHTQKIVQKNQLANPPKTNLSGMYRGSIIVQHFLLGKKKFTDLTIR